MKNKITTIIIAFTFFSFTTRAQGFNLLWAKAITGTEIKVSQSITVDGSGNIYTVGYFQGTVDFDPGAGVYNLTSAGTQDIFVSKVDASGNFLWAKSMGGTDYNYGYFIALDVVKGAVYITGHFKGTTDFDPGAGINNLSATGNEDIFVCKLTASGDFVWAKSIGGVGYDEGSSIAVDLAGSVYATGYYSGTADFDPGAGVYNLTSSGGSADIFVNKLDSSGNLVWAKSMGSPNADVGNSIALDAMGNVYTTGYFAFTADFDPGAGVYNLTSPGDAAFVSKLSASGNFVWAKQFGGASSSSNSFGGSIVVDLSGNGDVYTTGSFQDTVDFDPGTGVYDLISTGGMYVSKLDSSGALVWAKSIGGTTNATQSLAIDSTGNGDIYITGRFQNTVDFDPGTAVSNLTSAGGNDIFISKMDVSGTFLWAKEFGSAGDDYANAVAVDKTYNVAITGAFSDTVDFDPAAGVYNLSGGVDDIFILKLCQTTVMPGAISGAATICSGSSNTYTVAAVSGAGSYTWSLPGGWSGTSTTNSISATASAGGGTITVTANNTCGSSYAQTLPVTVNPLPNLAANTTAAAVCMGDSVTLTGSGATTYTWNNGVTNGVAFVPAGTLTYSVTGTDGNGCVNTASVNVTVNSLPVVTANTTASVVCSGDSVTLSGGGATTYTWNNGVTNGVAFAPAGTLTYSVTGIDGNGCVNSASVTVTVNLTPSTPTITPTGFTLTSSSASGNQWYLNGTLIAGATGQTYTAATNGTYVVVVTANGCSSAPSSPVVVGSNRIDETSNINSLNIYPNPADNQVIISSSSILSTITIFNSLGEIVLQAKSKNTQEQLDISSLRGGVYIIQTNTSRLKFIKE